MRPNIKGGVWRNVEDEILKVSVMKYGLNQWGRIASLLTRKSPAQCKARWYEWLDPSIKKSEWTKEEEEKLLHLAKIFPSQWKTIGPLVGRTAAQCLEHYNRLLDAVQQDGGEGGSASTDGTSEDVRRLRAGEIEPLPETKPAKPDPIDMDEDEKETLSEAKARLSNTHGKKEKRKFRERQLEEARRLAFLQKKRELKAAGIILKEKQKKKDLTRFDYSEEIPFYKKPLAGFYDTTEENQVDPNKDRQFINARLDKMEEDKNREEKEKENKLAEIRKKKREAMALPDLIKQVNQRNDVDMTVKRSKMVLPTPQLTDDDLEEIAEFEKQQNKIAASGSSSATSALVGGFKVPQTPATSTGSSITARTPLREDNIKTEAKNLLAMTTAQTPLKGGANPTFNPSDLTSVTPSQTTQRTPNPIRTPNTLKQEIMAQSTPASSGFASTPLSSSKHAGGAVATERQSLLGQLNSLPKPVNEYEVSLPDEEPTIEEIEEDQHQVLDESERGIREDQEFKHKQQTKMKNRSTVMKKSLPRAQSTIKEKKEKENRFILLDIDDQLQKAEQLLIQEMNNIILNDNSNFPLQSDNPIIDEQQQYSPESYETFTNKEMDQAIILLKKEMDLMKQENHNQQKSNSKNKGQEEEEQVDVKDYDKMIKEEFVNNWEKVNEKYVFVSTEIGYMEKDKVTDEQYVKMLTEEYNLIINAMKIMSKKTAAIEKKVTAEHQPYVQRLTHSSKTIGQLYDELVQLSIELQCFRDLAIKEKTALEQRHKSLENLVYDQCDRENNLQTRYAKLMNKKNNLLLLINQK